MKLKVLICSLVFCMVFPATVFALSGNVGAGLNVNSGSSDKVSGNLNFEIRNKSEVTKLKINGDYNYSEEDGTKDDEEVYIRNEFELDLIPRVYWLSNNSVRYRKKEGLDHRVNFGTGLGFKFIEDEVKELSVEGGAYYVIEKYTDEELTDEVNPFIAQKFSLEYADIVISERIEYLPDTEDREIYCINSYVDLFVEVFSNVGLKVGIRDHYNSCPDEGKEKNEFIMTSSIAYSF